MFIIYIIVIAIKYQISLIHFSGKVPFVTPYVAILRIFHSRFSAISSPCGGL